MLYGLLFEVWVAMKSGENDEKDEKDPPLIR